MQTISVRVDAVIYKFWAAFAPIRSNQFRAPHAHGLTPAKGEETCLWLYHGVEAARVYTVYLSSLSIMPPPKFPLPFPLFPRSAHQHYLPGNEPSPLAMSRRRRPEDKKTSSLRKMYPS